MRQVQWRWSNENKQWASKEIRPLDKVDATLSLNGQEYQKMFGFGACFNELGWRAIEYASEKEREKLFHELFSSDDECAKFNVCRLPIGASDYAFNWYSMDEVPGDYELKHFSVQRDREALIPYIKEALKIAPDIKLFASPWSPPTWMKYPPVYNWGKLIWTEENLRAYANYLVKFITTYEAEGIDIDQLHVQNEPVANQKFPSCMWTGEELKEFIQSIFC